MRQLWHVPTLHLPAERDDALLRYVYRVPLSPVELRIWRAWEETSRDIFRMVAAFGRVSSIHVFPESFVEPLYLLRPLHRFQADIGSVQTRIALGLEALGARIHAVDTMTISRTQEDRIINTRFRDEDFAYHIARDVPDGHVALLMLGAAHEAERLIRERSNFSITTVGTLGRLYAELLAETRSPS